MTSGQTKAINTATFQFQRKLLFCGERCSLRPDLRNASRCKKSILCVTAGRGKKDREKKSQGCNTAGMCFCISDDKNLNLFLSSLVKSC